MSRGLAVMAPPIPEDEVTPIPEDEDVALKILHTADWHLGRRFPSFEEADRTRLSRARLEVVERIFALAEQRQVDAVLCAGDLFDDVMPDRDWFQGLANVIRKRGNPERPVVLLPGNHDPLVGGSVWSPEHELRRLLPDFVHVVDRDDFELPLGDDAVVLARPCRSKAGQGDNALALGAREPGDSRIRIGLVHGSTFDIPGWQQNFPIAQDAAVRRGFDYLAIGDTHAFRIVPPDAEVPTVYPSAPEATNFGELDTGYVAMVLFSRSRRALVQRERVSMWTWEHVRVESLDALRALAKRDLSHVVLRVELDLVVDPEGLDEVEETLVELRGNDVKHGRAGALQIEREGLQLTTDGIDAYFDGLPEVLQRTARRLQEIEAVGERAAEARRALYHLYRLSRGVSET